MARRRKSRKAAWAAGGVTAILLGALTWWVFFTEPEVRRRLEAAAVELGDLTVELPATGSIDAVNVIDVGAVVSGRIESLHADFNQRVRAGQLLAQIEDDDYRSDWIRAQADLKAAEASVEGARANLEATRGEVDRTRASRDRARSLHEKQRQDWERQQKLAESGLTSASATERMEAALKGAAADLASAEAGEQQAQARVKAAAAQVQEAQAIATQRAARAALAKRNLDFCRIASPVDGIVVSRNVDVGQTIASRLSAPSLFHIAEDLTHMYVYTKLDSSDIAKVRPGLAAAFTVNAFPGEVFHGKLIQVRIEANAVTPVSRASNPVGQTKRTISAGVTVASAAGSELGSATAAGGASGSGASGGGGSGASTSSGSTSGSAPPTGSRNTVAVYDALIEFENPDEKLLPGMTAYVTIPLGSAQAALKVPNAALRFDPELPDDEKQRLLGAAGVARGGAVVWVVLGERRFQPVAVKPLLTDFVFTAVESTGLKPGMPVAIAWRSGSGSS